MKVSVITAVMNGRATVEDCLRSVAAQGHMDREHVVIDGLSTDGTHELLHKYASDIGVLVIEPDSGIYNALNKGIRRSTGDVIGFLHSDDVFADPDVLARVATVFEDPAVDIAYGDLVYVDRRDTRKTSRYWRAGAFATAQLGRGWMPPHPTVYARREVYARIGGFDETYRIAADYECILRMFANRCLRTVYIPEVLVKMRRGGISNSSIRNVLRKSAEDYRALRANGVGGVGTLLLKNVRKIGQFFQAPVETEIRSTPSESARR